MEEPESGAGREEILDAAESGTEEDELDEMARVTNASDLLPEDREIVRGLLDDTWVAGVDGPLRVGVDHGYGTEPGYEGLTAVTFDFVTPNDKRGFSFDWDACGTQPDIVNGVRYVVDPQGHRNRSGEPWVIKSFTWEGEAGARHSCV